MPPFQGLANGNFGLRARRRSGYRAKGANTGDATRRIDDSLKDEKAFEASGGTASRKGGLNLRDQDGCSDVATDAKGLRGS